MNHSGQTFCLKVGQLRPRDEGSAGKGPVLPKARLDICSFNPHIGLGRWFRTSVLGRRKLRLRVAGSRKIWQACV